MHESLRDLAELAELASDEKDDDALDDVAEELERTQDRLAQLEFRRMFQGEMDPANAYLEIQSGSGGTEAQDWAEMLLRMYLKWSEKRGFKATVTELSPGEVAGVKSATVQLEGEYAYGWLRTETGVHRLVRKSPFDSGNRRHTSFASVFVAPEIDDDIEIDVNPADVRVDTYRASGAGGQHVNRTDSAVRLTHLPTSVPSIRTRIALTSSCAQSCTNLSYRIAAPSSRRWKTRRRTLAGAARFAPMFLTSPE
jgi:peptide chain release factor 2